jgi:hypothetical protein
MIGSDHQEVKPENVKIISKETATTTTWRRSVLVERWFRAVAENIRACRETPVPRRYCPLRGQ